ncbi:hypothetical protein N7470_001870 [Penicillium chermesinum]|nr:hypothetical protein N7470_001870 [Penicillium chermesinum]
MGHSRNLRRRGNNESAMIFHLFRVWLAKGFGSKFGSSHKTHYEYPSSAFQRIGAPRAGVQQTTNSITNGMTLTESEERMVDGDIDMKDLSPVAAPGAEWEAPDTSSSAVVVSHQIDITHEAIGRTRNQGRRMTKRDQTLGLHQTLALFVNRGPHSDYVSSISIIIKQSL